MLEHDHLLKEKGFKTFLRKNHNRTVLQCGCFSGWRVSGILPLLGKGVDTSFIGNTSTGFSDVPPFLYPSPITSHRPMTSESFLSTANPDSGVDLTQNVTAFVSFWLGQPGSVLRGKEVVDSFMSFAKMLKDLSPITSKIEELPIGPASAIEDSPTQNPELPGFQHEIT